MGGEGKQMTDHPIQPLEKDKQGVLRFKENPIVRFLLDAGPFDMHQLALMPFDDEDREQFAQLIGYSLSGFDGLYYVSDKTLERAEAQKANCMGQKRFCFNCTKQQTCFLYGKLIDLIYDHHGQILNGDKLPGKIDGIYEALANACVEFRPQPECNVRCKE